MLLASNILFAQNQPENHGLVHYSDDPERIDIQGQIVIPTVADPAELRTPHGRKSR